MKLEKPLREEGAKANNDTEKEIDQTVGGVGHTAFIIGGRSGEIVSDAKSWRERYNE